MDLKGAKFFQTIFLAVFLFILPLTFVNSPGTGDVPNWAQWVRNEDQLGIAAGYAANEAPYPPLSSLILEGLYHLISFTGVSISVAVKIAILLFLFLSTVLFWWWTRDFALTIVLHLSLILSSAALGYLDVLFAPCIILALWAIKQQKLTLFAIFYSVACLTKWQPIVIAPFLGMYILNIDQIASWKQIDFKRLLVRVLVPALTILALTLFIYGVGSVLQSIKIAVSDEYLSGNALNLNWILTHWLRAFHPEEFGGLVQGQAKYIRTSSLQLRIVPDLLFYILYVSIFVTFLRRERTFENLLNFSLMGYLAYFILNTGVHENHMFPAMILSIILCWVNRDHLYTMITLILASNINLFLFYGFKGEGMGFSRVIGKTVDLALILSLLNVGFFLMLWIINVFGSRSVRASESS